MLIYGGTVGGNYHQQSLARRRIFLLIHTTTIRENHVNARLTQVTTTIVSEDDANDKSRLRGKILDLEIIMD